jgi:hypothetical protein
MRMIERPLTLSEEENRKDLLEAERLGEKHRRTMGDPTGNRHERRLAAKRERQAKRVRA